MRKAVSDGTRTTKEGSGRSYWVRSAPQEPKSETAESAAKRSEKPRFLEPYRLSPERRAELLEPLIAAGIGDSDSRDLFAAAVEYDIASCRQHEHEPEPEPEAATAPVSALPSGPLLDLSNQARALSAALDGIDPAAHEALAAALHGEDCFARVYTDGYLAAVATELRRIADAAQMAAPPAPPPEPPEPPISGAARRLVRRIASAYEECFERKAVVDGDGGAFEPLLRLIASESGIRLSRDPVALAESLARR